MKATGWQPQWVLDGAALHCERHRPEQTALYRLVQQHAASFIAHTEASTLAWRSHISVWRSRGSGVGVNALKVLAQPRHL